MQEKILFLDKIYIQIETAGFEPATPHDFMFALPTELCFENDISYKRLLYPLAEP